MPTYPDTGGRSGGIIMKIKQITLKNFRAAEDFILTLDENLTVIAGVNGSGKTTILDAVAIMLSWLTARIKRDGAPGSPIKEFDITHGKFSSMIKIETVDETTSWTTVKNKKGKKELQKSDYTGLNQYVKNYKNRAEESDEIPLYTYYPVNRAVIQIPLRIKKRHKFDLFSIYEDGLTGGADFKLFFEWFREREDLENENRRYLDDLIKPDDFEFPDKQLQAVRTALTTFLPEYTDFSVKRQPLRMVVKKNGKELRIDYLSDGEKGVIALVGDIARRLSIANSLKSNSLEGEGIVLIDEIDLHLHPAWQRMIVPKLRAVFPNIQFIISTHSPQVLSEIEAKNLRMMTLEENNLSVHIPKQSYGLTSQEILQEIMGDGGRNKDVIARIDRIFELIDVENFQQARCEIKALKDKLGGAIPDIIEAEATITMLESEPEPDRREDI